MRYLYSTCPCGQIKGLEGKDYNLFKAIRYATAQRWESPEEVTAWEGTYDATTPGKNCFQSYTYATTLTGVARFYTDENPEKQAVLYTEDCQMLHIFSPRNAEKAPVLVYIHGGGYETGGFSIPNYRGEPYCANGIVLVLINYRLNAFSAGIGDGHTGNYGLQDQICALRWIRRNIAAFGGDPDRVTIMGESAGAMSVQNLIYAPQAKGLFHGAIMMSGGGILPSAYCIKSPETALEMWEEIKSRLGAATLDQLKDTDPETLYKTWRAVYDSNPKYLRSATPVVDGITIPDDPRNLVRDGKINGVPTIISLLSEDMWPHTLYRTALEWGQLMAQTGQPPVYGMYFDRQVPGTDIGAFHAADVRYAFATLETSWRPYEDTDYRISRDIVAYFSAFVKTGVPQVEGLPTWESITRDNCSFLHFGDDPCSMVSVPADRLEKQEAKRKPFPGM